MGQKKKSTEEIKAWLKAGTNKKKFAAMEAFAELANHRVGSFPKRPSRGRLEKD